MKTQISSVAPQNLITKIGFHFIYRNIILKLTFITPTQFKNIINTVWFCLGNKIKKNLLKIFVTLWKQKIEKIIESFVNFPWKSKKKLEIKKITFIVLCLFCAINWVIKHWSWKTKTQKKICLMVVWGHWMIVYFKLLFEKTKVLH